jgi:hypothetical protein
MEVVQRKSFTFWVTLTSLNRTESTIVALKSGNRVGIEDITPVGCCDKNGGGESEFKKGEVTGFVGTKPVNPV